MDRKNYWEQYTEYFLDLTDDANREGEITSLLKESAGDFKTPGELILTKFFQIIKTEKEDKLLDYGCGFGRFYPYFSIRSDYYGIDISRTMIDEGQKRYPQAKDRFLVAEGENLPFKAGYFDKIICYGVFDACYQERALEEIMRVCRVGGEILITGKNINYLCDDKQALIAEEAARKKGHPNYFTDVKAMLQQLEHYVKIIETRFFLKRGDFAQDKYVEDMPEEFYEWALVFRKIECRGILKLEKFSDEYSNTWKKLV